MKKIEVKVFEFTRNTVDRVLNEQFWFLNSYNEFYQIGVGFDDHWEFVYTDDEVNNDDCEFDWVFDDKEEDNKVEVR